MYHGTTASQNILYLIYGALFFGVPNQGMDIKSLIPMASDQPNQALLHSLGTESQVLRDLGREFPKAFNFGDSEIICFYETRESPTAIKVSRGFTINRDMFSRKTSSGQWSMAPQRSTYHSGW